jgi:short-subunit dehydrogenase
MIKPNMLITGTSRGIGLECARHFNNNYNIIGIARTPGEFSTKTANV